ncbi:MAG: hypothetical protein QT05_C0050G0035 [archaeon GW2011_AR13]|nr:MAG: hypothetical protein QT05_C0050G0035 [archaeon GW2011_AR13]HIG95117.1 hypothetical protein [Nanoarchaeota archaeon]HIH63199.1 hypothetical protein [Nanoarchaeota archaeon]HIJ09303.1 hypothetical protein [Nanoarchaeota archaeon]
MDNTKDSSNMSLDYLFKLFKTSLDTHKIFFYQDNRNYGYISKDTIYISDSYPIKQQVLTIAHEILHFHPKFLSYTIKSERMNECAEFAITRFAKKILHNRKDIANLVREAYNFAKKRDQDVQREEKEYLELVKISCSSPNPDERVRAKTKLDNLPPF